MNKKPFIHKFKTDDNNYIYDVNTNSIIEADDIVYDIIDYFGELPPSRIIENFSEKYDVNSISERIDSIKQSQAEGLFSDFHPKISEYPKNFAEIRSELDSNMSLLTLEVTQQCNLRCRYCIYSDKYYYTRKHSFKSMDFCIAKKAIDYFLAHSSKSKQIYIGFYGGEPLLNFGLIKSIVDYTNNKLKQQREISYTVTTNGTLLDDRKIKFFVNNDFNMLVSLDGPIEIHDRNRIYRNGRGSYKTIIGNLRKIKEQYPTYYTKNIGFNAVVSPPYDFRKLDRFFSSFDLIVENSIRLEHAGNLNTSYYEDFEESELQDVDGNKELIEKYIRFYTQQSMSRFSSAELAVARFLANEYLLMRIYKRPLFSRPKKEVYPGGCCIPGVARCFVTAEGRFFPCERVNTNNDELCIGNVESGIEFEKVLKIIERTTERFQKNCSDCWACRLCNLCYIYTERRDHTLGQGEKICGGMKKSIHEALQLFCHIMAKNPNAFDEWKN